MQQVLVALGNSEMSILSG